MKVYDIALTTGMPMQVYDEGTWYKLWQYDVLLQEWYQRDMEVERDEKTEIR